MAKAMSGQGVTGREAELYGAKRDNEGAEQGGDGAVAEHVGGGAEAGHRVPTHWGHPRVLERLSQVRRRSAPHRPPPRRSHPESSLRGRGIRSVLFFSTSSSLCFQQEIIEWLSADLAALV